MNFKKLLFSFVLMFTLSFSISATSNNNSESNDNDAISLTYVDGTGTLGTSSSNEVVSKLVDGSSSTKWCSSVSGGHFSAVFKAQKRYCITKYVLVTGNDSASYSSRNWKDWKIYGGNSSSGSWNTLVSHSGSGLPAENNKSVTYTDISNTGFYEYFYIDFYANSGDTQQMSEMTLYGSSSDTELTNMKLTYANKGNVGTPSGSQTPDKLVDGVINTNSDKWCSFMSSSSSPTFSAVFSANEEFTLCSYVLRTGGDSGTYSNRNWKNWKISGGDSSDGPWTKLVEHNGSSLSGNSTPFAFTDVTYKDKAFKYFMVEYEAQSEQSTNYYCQQMELMEFYGIYQYGISYFDEDSELSLTPKTYLKGTGVSSLPTTTKTGYSFAGWYDAKTGGNKVTSISTSDTGNKVLYARWNKQYSVTFDTQGHGTAPTSETVDEGNKVTKPNDPTAEGYMFQGWYKESGCINSWDFNTDTISSNTTLYAKWISADISTNSIGGYYKKGNNKQQVVMFGFTFNEYNELSEGDSCGIYLYSDSGSTLISELTSTAISDLKAKEGRFYTTKDVDEGKTIYAKAYVVVKSKICYSSLINATGNFDTEYKI